jgi:hypothetical protein
MIPAVRSGGHANMERADYRPPLDRPDGSLGARNPPNQKSRKI